MDITQTFEKLYELLGEEQLADLLDITTKSLKSWRREQSIPKESTVSARLDQILDSISKPAIKPDTQFTFIDLFAGIGGMRLGFESEGGQCVFTSEWDRFSQKTYIKNYGKSHPVLGDIAQVDTPLVPDHDLLLAGFPCQPFSVAGVSKKNALGHAHGFECETQGTLFFELERIIEAKRPKAFLLENVKNLKSHDRGRTFDTIMRTLKDKLGYQVFYKIIDALIT